MSAKQPETIGEIILEAINDGWFLRSKQDYPNGFTGADVRSIQDKAKAALSAMVAEIIGETIVIGSGATDDPKVVQHAQEALRQSQRQRATKLGFDTKGGK